MSRAVAAASAKANRHFDGMRRKAASVGRAARRIGENAQDSVTGVRALAGAFAGLAVGTAVLDRQKEIQRLAQIAKVSVPEIQRLGFIADQTGGNMEDIADATREMQLRLIEAVKDGTGPAATALEHLNLTFEDLQGLDTPAQFDKIRERIALLNGPLATTEQRQLALFAAEELLGGSSERLQGLLELSAEDYAELSDKASRQVTVTKENSAAVTALSRFISGSLNQALAVLINLVGTIVRAFQDQDSALGKTLRVLAAVTGAITALVIAWKIGMAAIALSTKISMTAIKTAIASNPIGLLIVAITTVVTVAYMFRKELAGVFATVLEAIGGFVAGAIRFFADFIRIVGRTVQGAADLLNKIPGVNIQVEGSFNSLADNIESFAGVVEEKVGAAASKVREYSQSGKDAVTEGDPFIGHLDAAANSANILGQKAGDAADEVAALNKTFSLFDTAKARTEMLAAAAAAQINNAVARGDDPFIAAQDALTLLNQSQQQLQSFASTQDVLGIWGGRASKDGKTTDKKSGGDGANDADRKEEARAALQLDERFKKLSAQQQSEVLAAFDATFGLTSVELLEAGDPDTHRDLMTRFAAVADLGKARIEEVERLRKRIGELRGKRGSANYNPEVTGGLSAFATAALDRAGQKLEVVSTAPTPESLVEAVSAVETELDAVEQIIESMRSATQKAQDKAKSASEKATAAAKAGQGVAGVGQSGELSERGLAVAQGLAEGMSLAEAQAAADAAGAKTTGQGSDLFTRTTVVRNSGERQVYVVNETTGQTVEMDGNRVAKVIFKEQDG